MARPAYSARYVSTAETAKLMRQQLKAAFPATKFSVRSSRGCSISIRWTDGPTPKDVEAITDQFGGKGFDGMIDLAYTIDSWVLNGEILGTRSTGTEGGRGSVSAWGLIPPHDDAELVHFSAGYVSTSRTVSPELANRAIAQLVAYWGGVTEIPVAVPGCYGDGYRLEPVELGHRSIRPDLPGYHYDWNTMIHQATRDPAKFTVEVPSQHDGR